MCFDFNPTCEMIGLWLWEEISKQVQIPVHLGKTGALGTPPAI